MSGANFLDSNILVYTDDHDAPEKQAIALALLEAGQARRNAFVSTQMLEEYFSAATTKLRVPAVTARGKVELFGQLQVVLAEVDVALSFCFRASMGPPPMIHRPCPITAAESRTPAA